MWKTILDLFFPINCLGCGQEGQFICPACFEQIPLNRETPFKFSSTSLTGLMIASDYDYPLVKQAIHRYKYDFVKDLAEPLGQLMANRLGAILSTSKVSWDSTLLIPVPLHKKRLRWRGFNQAELLAQKISQELRIPLINNLLIRAKYRLPQMAIKSSQERKANIKQAFELKKPKRLVLKNFKDDASGFKNKTIILVDDVSTTGATLEECAQVLKRLKPKQIWGLVIARG
ncbi:MAG: ComF family protein [Candidatus Portnoybacteria bacterium]|nr:ComF family protein [Candidatus Portnoybacteria bacterium]